MFDDISYVNAGYLKKAMEPKVGGYIVVEHNGLYITWNKSDVIHCAEKQDIALVIHGLIYLPHQSGLAFQQQAEYLIDEYIEKGLEAFASVSGHYCVFILDKKNNKIIFIGDPSDGRRVYFGETPSGYFISSKLMALANVDNLLCKRNSKYLEFSLIYGFTPFEESIFEKIKRLSPKKVGLLTPDGYDFITRNVAEIEQSFNITDRENTKSKLNNLLVDTCGAALGDTKKVGVLLGGFDSAFIASLAKRLGKEVKAYTFKYDDDVYDQGNINSVIDYLNIEHEWIEINSDIFHEGLQKYSAVFDRPTNWPNYVIQSAYLAEVAKKDGMEVILTGDGCDEAFLGYPGIYRGASFFSKNFSETQRDFFKLAKRVSQNQFLESHLGHTYRLLLRILSNLQLNKKARLYLMFRILDENTLKGLFGWDVKYTENKVLELIKEVIKEVPDDLSETILAYEGREHIIPNKIKLTGMMDVTGIPVYSPFLHQQVRDYVRQFPEAFLRPEKEAKRDSLGKYILLEMAEEHGYLPNEVIYQPKHAAVDGPLDNWYATALRSFSKGAIRNIGPIYSEKFLNRLLDEKSLDKWYRKNYSVDNITSHAASILTTYGSYFATDDYEEKNS